MQPAVAEKTSGKTSTEFGAPEFKAMAQKYAEHKPLVDALARGISKAKGGYENLDDAIAQIREAWTMFESVVEKGERYTPPLKEGFGQNNAPTIVRSLIGETTTVGELRKAAVTLAKS